MALRSPEQLVGMDDSDDGYDPWEREESDTMVGEEQDMVEEELQPPR